MNDKPVALAVVSWDGGPSDPVFFVHHEHGDCSMDPLRPEVRLAWCREYREMAAIMQEARRSRSGIDWDVAEVRMDIRKIPWEEAAQRMEAAEKTEALAKLRRTLTQREIHLLGLQGVL